MVMQRGWDSSRDEEYWYDDGLPEGATYTPAQEAYLQSIREAFNDLAGRYPGAALIAPDYMNSTYGQGSEIDKAMASGKTPEQMISNLGYGVMNYGDVEKGGTKTGTPGVGYQYLTPGQTYTLIDNSTGKQTGPAASTPQELQSLTSLANQISNSSGNKADWSIVTDYGTDTQKPVASDVRDPDENLDWLYGLLAAAAAVGAPWALGAFSGLGAGALGAAEAAGALAPVVSTPAVAIGGAGGLSALGGLATAAPFLGETALVTAPAIGSGIASTLVPAAIAGGGLGAALSNIATQVPTLPQAPVSPGVEEIASTAPASGSGSAAPAVTAGGLAAGTSALPVETATSTAEAPSSGNINDILDTLAAGSTLPPIVGGETTTVTGNATPSDAQTLQGDLDAKLALELGTIASTVPNLPAATTPTTPPAPTSPDYLSYIRTALGLGSLLGGGSGGSGAAAGTGTTPGGSGLMPPSFATDKLPTGDAIPAFGGGTSLASRTARDMGDIDYNRYGFGPERSFFANVPQRAAKGGSMAVTRPSKSFAVQGAGDGRSDDIPAVLSDGEYVIDAETVALLGNGSNKAGAAQLDRFRANVRKHKGKDLAKGRFSVNAKAPQAYMAGGRS